jgi:Alginate export
MGVEFHQSTTTTRPRRTGCSTRLVSASDLFERNWFANLEPRPSRCKAGVQPLCPSARMTVNKEAAVAWQPDRRVRYNFGTTEGEKEWHSGSYETPFPKGLYYGFIDDSGSLNAIVLHGKIALQSSRTISLASDGFFFWRLRTTDGLYCKLGALLRNGLASQENYVGALQGIAITWTVNHHTTLQLVGAYYEVGAFLRETPPPGRTRRLYPEKGSTGSDSSLSKVTRV